MVVVSSSAKHLQSQHPCEKGAAIVKQHFCPVRLSLAFHSLQHNLTGLPCTNRKFHSCKESRQKQNANLGACQHRNYLQEHLDLLIQAGKPAQPSPLTRAAKRQWSTLSNVKQRAPKAALQWVSWKQSFWSKFCNGEATQANLLCCKGNRPPLSCNITNLQTFHLCHYSPSDKSSHLNSIQIPTCATSWSSRLPCLCLSLFQASKHPSWLAMYHSAILNNIFLAIKYSLF